MTVSNSEKCIIIYEIGSAVPLGITSNEVTSTIGDIKSLLVLDLSTSTELNHQTKCYASMASFVSTVRDSWFHLSPSD